MGQPDMGHTTTMAIIYWNGMKATRGVKIKLLRCCDQVRDQTSNQARDFVPYQVFNGVGDKVLDIVDQFLFKVVEQLYHEL